jgi:hypothetical protein
MGWNILGHHRPSPNDRVFSDGNRAKDLCPDGNGDAVSQGGVALRSTKLGDIRRVIDAEGYSLVQGHVVSNLGSLADYDTHAVVNEKATANPGPRMDFNSSHESRKVGNQAWQNGHAVGKQHV